jgi:hypothetical protein
MTLTSDSVALPGGKTYKNGEKCDGKPAQLYVKQYPYVGAAAGTIQTTSAPDVRLVDGALLTVAFVAPAHKDAIPAPPQSVQAALKTIITPPTTTTTTTTPASTTTTKAGASTTTTGSSSTTKAPKSSKKKKTQTSPTSTTTTKPAATTTTS